MRVEDDAVFAIDGAVVKVEEACGFWSRVMNRFLGLWC